MGTGGVPGIQTLRARPFTHQELPKELSQSLAQVEGQQGGLLAGWCGTRGVLRHGHPTDSFSPQPGKHPEGVSQALVSLLHQGWVTQGLGGAWW